MIIRINWIAATRYLVKKKAQSGNAGNFQFCVKTSISSLPKFSNKILYLKGGLSAQMT